MRKRPPPGAPKFAGLPPSGKRLVRKLGGTPEHCIRVPEGNPGQGWESLYSEGWIRIAERGAGYTIQFTLDGWEWWCEQVDIEEQDGDAEGCA